MTGVEADRDSRASIEKAISLLVSLGHDTGDGLGVSELARRADLSKSTAFRVLGVLERNGLVRRNGPSYELGAVVHDLGRRAHTPQHEQMRDVLTPHLTDLFTLTGLTVHLAVLHGTDVLYLAKLYGHRHPPTPSRVGARLPAHTTGVGKALLAHDPTALDRVLRTPLRALTTRSVIDPRALQRAAENIRDDGLAFDHEESASGLYCVAAPILGAGRRPLAALSISGHSQETSRPAQIAHLRTVAAAATVAVLRAGSRAVGHHARQPVGDRSLLTG